MLLQTINESNYVTGILASIIFGELLIIGIRVFIKFLKLKRTDVFFLGVYIIALAFIWISGLKFILLSVADYFLPDVLYAFSTQTAFYTTFFASLFYITTTSYPQKKKIILSVTGMFLLLLEMLFISILIIKPKWIGSVVNDFTFDYNIIYDIITYVIIATTSIMFYIFCIILKRSTDRLTQWKGKLLLWGELLFVLPSMIDLAIKIPILQTICRSFIVASPFFMYFAFFLPKFIVKKI